MVPLRTKLKNGDIVEIVTNPTHKPSRDWLNFVATSRARNKIKHLIQERGEAARRSNLGRKLLEKEARRFDVNLEQAARRATAFTKAANELGVQKVDELFAQLGYGKLSPKQRARQARAAGRAEGEGAGASGRLGGQARAQARRPRPIASTCAASTT